jgi:hypothetical protein
MYTYKYVYIYMEFSVFLYLWPTALSGQSFYWGKKTGKMEIIKYIILKHCKPKEEKHKG